MRSISLKLSKKGAPITVRPASAVTTVLCNASIYCPCMYHNLSTIHIVAYTHMYLAVSLAYEHWDTGGGNTCNCLFPSRLTAPGQYKVYALGM